MKHSIYKHILSIGSGPKDVLLLSPLHLVLILIVPLLFVLAFAASFSSSAPQKALLQLKQYLASIGQLGSSDLFTKEEVVNLEKRLNQVKTRCTPEALSRDRELKALLQSVQRQLAGQAETGVPSPPSLRMFGALIQEFYTAYFPGAAPSLTYDAPTSGMGNQAALLQT